MPDALCCSACSRTIYLKYSERRGRDRVRGRERDRERGRDRDGERDGGVSTNTIFATRARFPCTTDCAAAKFN